MSSLSGRIRILLIEDSLTDAKMIGDVLSRESPASFEIAHLGLGALFTAIDTALAAKFFLILAGLSLLC